MKRTLIVAIVAGLPMSQSAVAQSLTTSSDESPLPGSNTIFVRQESGIVGGNTLFVDQRLAAGALVAGSTDGTVPATQVGSNNAANVSIQGVGGTVLLLQGTTAAPAFDNVAAVTLSGLNPLGTLEQLGSGNFASLDLAGAAGVLRQNGNGNDGRLFVEGNGTFGELNQVGDGIEQSLTVIGNGTSISYTLTGQNLAPTGNTGNFGQPLGVQVISNANTVTINQSAFPSP